MGPVHVVFVSLVLSICCIHFFDCEELKTGNDLTLFGKWFYDHGAKCRCRFFKDKHNKFTAVADRRIIKRESILMVPQSLLVNSTTVER